MIIQWKTLHHPFDLSKEKALLVCNTAFGHFMPNITILFYPAVKLTQRQNRKTEKEDKEAVLTIKVVVHWYVYMCLCHM